MCSQYNLYSRNLRKLRFLSLCKRLPFSNSQCRLNLFGLRSLRLSQFSHNPSNRSQFNRSQPLFQ